MSFSPNNDPLPRYNPEPHLSPPKRIIPPNMLINPLTGIEVLNYDEAILIYQAADICYQRIGQVCQNMPVYGPICMVCKSAVVALRAAMHSGRPLKSVLDEYKERLDEEKRGLGLLK